MALRNFEVIDGPTGRRSAPFVRGSTPRHVDPEPVSWRKPKRVSFKGWPRLNEDRMLRHILNVKPGKTLDGPLDAPIKEPISTTSLIWWGLSFVGASAIAIRIIIAFAG